MRPRDFGFLVTGFVLAIFFRLFLNRLFAPPDAAPTLAGQEVPAERHQINFDNLLNIYAGRYGTDRQIYKNVKLLGFTGAKIEKQAALESSNAYASYGYYNYFDRWLVLRLEDGRKAYLSPNSVEYIEEVK